MEDPKKQKKNKLGLGLWGASGDWKATTNTEPKDLIEHAVKEGVDTLDTAPVYGSGVAHSQIPEQYHRLVSTKIPSKRNENGLTNIENLYLLDLLAKKD